MYFLFQIFSCVIWGAVPNFNIIPFPSKKKYSTFPTFHEEVIGHRLPKLLGVQRACERFISLAHSPLTLPVVLQHYPVVSQPADSEALMRATARAPAAQYTAQAEGHFKRF